jgi:hypothetical protein
VGWQCRRDKPRVVEVGKGRRERVDVPIQTNGSRFYNLATADVFLVLLVERPKADREVGDRIDATNRENPSLISALFL